MQSTYQTGRVGIVGRHSNNSTTKLENSHGIIRSREPRSLRAGCRVDMFRWKDYSSFWQWSPALTKEIHRNATVVRICHPPTRSDLDRSKTRINTRVNRNLTGAVLDLIPQIGDTGRALLVVAGFKMIKLHTSRRSYKRVATCRHSRRDLTTFATLSPPRCALVSLFRGHTPSFQWFKDRH